MPLDTYSQELPDPISTRTVTPIDPTQGQKGLPFGSGEGIPYAPGAQPQTTPRGGSPAYYIGPEQLYPLQIRPINNRNDLAAVQKEIWKQMIPSSVNLRNYTLQQLLEQRNMPMEQLYANQASNPVAIQNNQLMDSLRAEGAQRGLSQSGQMDEQNLKANMGYLQGMASASLQGRQQEDQRQNILLQQLLDIPEADLRFYQAINSGSIPAGSLWSEHAKDYEMMMYGTGTAIRKGAMAAAGGGDGGGMGMGAGGMMGGGGGGMGWTSFMGGGQ